jgi:pimeloyl-ACP methyl ester carboxylesterase
VKKILPVLCVWFACGLSAVLAQQPPYDVFPDAQPPYYRVRFEASTQSGGLIFPVNYTVWVPPDVKVLRGVVVHQHGCGEGSCKSGLTGAFDLHWQSLARKHQCALLAPSYEQPENADCQMWCDPRNGSGEAFQKGLAELGKLSGHSELATVPWALWGHSGGGHWIGGMALLHPDRVAAAWFRSGVPLLNANPDRPTIKPHLLNEAALGVPMMCNPGTQEGVTVTEGRFAQVWKANQDFFFPIRAKGGLIGIAIDPLTSHECGNQRYLAIPWLDACLTLRLPDQSGQPLKTISKDQGWLAPLSTTAEGLTAPTNASEFQGNIEQSVWLPTQAIANAWLQYVTDTAVSDDSPPPSPSNVRIQNGHLLWDSEADIESGLASFIIHRDGKFLANVPEKAKNPFGRTLFQNLQYSDTPTFPLTPMQFKITDDPSSQKPIYKVIAVNTVGLKSEPSAIAK